MKIIYLSEYRESNYLSFQNSDSTACPCSYPSTSDTRCSWISILYILRHSVELFIIRNSLGSHQTCPFEFQHLLYVDTKVIISIQSVECVTFKHLLLFSPSTRSMCRSHKTRGLRGLRRAMSRKLGGQVRLSER